MKKSIFTILLISSLAFSIIACALPDNSQKGGEKVTVESILDHFDSDVYHAQHYDKDMISQVKQNIANQGITVSEEIKSIVHVTNQNDTSSEIRTWAYIYEFSDEADAIAFYENRSEYVKVALEDGLCIRNGLIVVFGSAEEISLIK